MSRVPLLDATDLSEKYRHLLDSPINLRRALANSPGALEAFVPLAMYIRRKSRLDKRLRELAIIQVGYLTKTAYEYSHHIEIGTTLGVTEDDVLAIAKETAGEISDLASLDRTVLRASREMTQDLAVTDDTWACLKASLDNVQLVDLVITVATYNSVVRILETLEIDLEPGYDEFLRKFPLA